MLDKVEQLGSRAIKVIATSVDRIGQTLSSWRNDYTAMIEEGREAHVYMAHHEDQYHRINHRVLGSEPVLIPRLSRKELYERASAERVVQAERAAEYYRSKILKSE